MIQVLDFEQDSVSGDYTAVVRVTRDNGTKDIYTYMFKESAILEKLIYALKNGKIRTYKDLNILSDLAYKERKSEHDDLSVDETKRERGLEWIRKIRKSLGNQS